MQLAISAALDNPTQSSPECAQRAAEWAQTATPPQSADGDDDSGMHERAIVGAAMIVMRDGTPDSRERHRRWAHSAFAAALRTEDDPGQLAHREERPILPRGASETMFRAKETTEVTSRDRKRYARARARGDALRQAPSAVVSARYDESRDRIDLAVESGVSMAIPRKLVPGLERASTSSLKVIEVSSAGDGLSWRSLDLDVYVPGLVEHAFGRLFAGATGRPGGRRRPKARAAAAKINGAKRGRRRKRLST